MKKKNVNINEIKNKRILKGILFIFPVVFLAWGEYIFSDMSETLVSIIQMLIVISLIIGIYNLYKSSDEYIINEMKPKDSELKTSKNKIKIDSVTETDNHKTKKKEPWIYKIPYEIMSNGLFILWALAGGYIAEYAETSPLINIFSNKNFLMAMLLAMDTIICLGIWFIYMGYFYNPKKRTLFLVLIIVIYLAFYLFMKQYE